MGIIKAVIFDIIGVTHPLSDLDLFRRDFLENGERYIAEVVEKGKSNVISLGVLEQIRRKLLTHDNSKLVAKLTQEVDNKNLDPDFMSLMGGVNAEGLQKGRYVTHVFSDVQDALLKLKRHFMIENPCINYSNKMGESNMLNSAGNGIYTFSNGSRQLQSEMFRNSVLLDGEKDDERLNLHRFFDGYFSTNGGFDNQGVALKDNHRSFLRVAKYLGFRPEEFFFFSDSQKELEAAHKAGLYVSYVNRSGNKKVTGNFKVINSLDSLKLH